MFLNKIKQRKVRGYTIKRMSAKAMLEATQELDGVVKGILSTMFETGSLTDLIDIKTADASDFMSLIFRSGVNALNEIFPWLAKTSGIPQEVLEDDPAFGISGVGEVLAAVLEVNEFEDFFSTAFPAIQSVWKGISPEKKMTANGDTSTSI